MNVGNFRLVSWNGGDIFAGGDTKKEQVKIYRTVAERAVLYYFVLIFYTADFGDFKYRVTTFPAVA